MKRILILIFVFSAFSATAQTFNKASFVQKVWFANNNNKAFWKSDTVRLIQLPNQQVEVKNTRYENALKYIGHRDYLIFEFKKQNKLILTEPVWEFNNGIPLGIFKWKYDKKANTISIFDNNELLAKLKPISRTQIKLYPKDSEQVQPVITEETIFVTSNVLIR